MAVPYKYMEKSTLSINGKVIKISAPITKVDQENRLVHGFATLDNIDKQDDLVEAQASRDAFANFRGNIREMHDRKAVGKMIDFRPEIYVHKDTDGNETPYEGVFVTAYISKGAEDTWQKCVDGTLSGFSIGGAVDEAKIVYHPELDKNIQHVQKYNLSELSLVDSPANQFSNIVSISKSIDGLPEMTGTITLVKGLKNVFLCNAEGDVLVSEAETADCHTCEKSMENIGWVEDFDDIKQTIVEKIASVKKVRNNNSVVTINGAEYKKDGTLYKLLDGNGNVVETPPATITKSEKGDDSVSDTTTEEVVESTEVVEPEGEVTETAEVEKSVDNAEVEEFDFAKSFETLTSTLQSALEKSATDTNALVEGIKDELAKAVDGVKSEITERVAALETKFGEFSGQVEEVEKGLKAVADGTALKKSADSGGSDEVKIEKSVWDSAFFPSADEI